MNRPGDVDAGYVIARQVLLDALEILLPLGTDDFIVVGAQAVYLRCGDVVTPIPALTIDSDIVIDISKREGKPSVRKALEARGFTLRDNQPGLYAAPNLPEQARKAGGVDLFVPEAFANGRGRRDARIPGDPQAARRQAGLEFTVLDRCPMRIAALDASDDREVTANVAGPASLMVSKLWKIGERLDSNERIQEKDMLDFYRLLQATSLEEVRAALTAAWSNAEVSNSVQCAANVIERYVVSRKPLALDMLDRYLAGRPERDEIIESTRILAAKLLPVFRSEAA